MAFKPAFQDVGGGGGGEGGLTPSQEAKLDSLQFGATKNLPDATLLARENHTGTQPINTVEGLQLALDDLESDVSALSTDKVDKDGAKQLSDENYTLNEKTKLANVGDPLRDFVTEYLITRG